MPKQAVLCAFLTTFGTFLLSWRLRLAPDPSPLLTPEREERMNSLACRTSLSSSQGQESAKTGNPSSTPRRPSGSSGLVCLTFCFWWLDSCLVLFVHIFDSLPCVHLNVCIHSLFHRMKSLVCVPSPGQVSRALLPADRCPSHTICLLACLSQSTCSKSPHFSAPSTCQAPSPPVLVLNFSR